MDLRGLIAYVNRERYGVVATTGRDGAPGAAYLPFAATDAGELVFDTKPDSRKVANLRADGRVAVVIGGPSGTTLQAEGVADFPEGDERSRCVDAYLATYPEFAGSVRGGGVEVVRVRLAWARFGDFRTAAAQVAEVDLG
ncbi:hypothetical protein FLP10_04645 [Agromyces intestinalis]|uniref:Pyridoxamine 5'-phosphate oxidase N-terminal domain-containing protein n=1 Tax=Agromyces intestinalis TaxID=2592652 RepID=A0A5C1YFL0_9MICO|nr:pyridoxamine 5'-phosphate oxidase family protein [Agromyces intestinalis]QEO13789.1 hypothetical protein FLP10_04645 [Agromyces intestinalis]